MKTIETSNLLLNENAYFYKKKKRVAAKNIYDLFKECKNDKGIRGTYTPIIRQSLFEDGLEIAKFSVLVFEYTQKPSFLKVPADLWENKTGLFVILEHGDYMSVLRKNVSGVRSLKQIAEEVDYSILANFMTGAGSRFEKIKSNSLNTAENAIQTKTSEAIDLKGIMNRFGISKQVISALQLDNQGEKSSISLNTSRVNSLNIRSEFENVLFWMVKIIKLIDGTSRVTQ
ncbi:MAG: hypothetical protein EOO20_26345 [Chryseobacterium sp.]|nr:MAG: hypothetical protein EOO20_26345 [Chryseobacterium sp.]